MTSPGRVGPRTGRPSSSAAAWTGLRDERAAAAAAAFGLGDDERDVVAGVDERLEGRDGGGGRAEEDEAHRRGGLQAVVAPDGRDSRRSRGSRSSRSASCAALGVEALQEEDAVEVVDLVLDEPAHELVALDHDLVARRGRGRAP